jgi:hypothetical protein
MRSFFRALLAIVATVLGLESLADSLDFSNVVADNLKELNGDNSNGGF